MLVLKTLTFTEFQNRLRKLGIGMSPNKARALIAQGLFNGVVFKVSETDYLILEREFEQWVNEHAVDEKPNADMLNFAKTQFKEA